MAIGYRSVLQLEESQDAFQVASDQMRGWLSNKSHRPNSGLETTDWEGEGEHQLGPNVTLTDIELISNNGRLRRISLEHVERTSAGIWTTRVYAMSNPDARRFKQVLWFESEGERIGSGAPTTPATPRIVRNTLETIAAHDASVPILGGSRSARIEDVDELLGFIQDEHRAISIVIAAPIPGVDSESWARAVDSLTRDTLGCASFFVPNEDAHKTLNKQLGHPHSIPLGAIRTFVPRVELGDAADARRHRILTAQTILHGLKDDLTFDERTRRLISITPRLALLERELPADLTRTARLLQRKRINDMGGRALSAPEQPIYRSSGTDTPLTSPSPTGAEFKAQIPWLGRLVALLRHVVGMDTVDEESLQALADRFDKSEEAARNSALAAKRLQDEREKLEDDVTDLRNQLEAERFERAIAEIDRQEAEGRVRALNHWRSQREDRFEFVEHPPEAWETEPASVMEIVERLTDGSAFKDIRNRVVLTDLDHAIDDAEKIDAIDKSSLYATSFWEYILVLRDYTVAVDEEAFDGNVHMYLRSPSVTGSKCPAQRHRSNESEGVQNNSRMRQERTFIVPTSVHPSGRMFMATHFAPTHRDQNAPRMYYTIEREGGRTIAYIGYIGLHLTNSKTN